MKLLVVALALICIVSMIFNIIYIEKLNNVMAQDRKYFAKLRKDYDMRIEECKQDILVRDKIIQDYKEVIYGR